MRYWRMAMRRGNQGSDLFPKCRELGIAAICYRDEHGRSIVGDCRRLSRDDYENTWRQKALTDIAGRVSLRRIAYEIRNGDVIYVKHGGQITGKGRVVGEYEYDQLVATKLGASGWSHFVKVRWDDTFVPFDCLLGAEQWTVLPLNKERLEKVRRSEKVTRNRSSADLDEGVADEIVGIEGETRRGLVQHRKREGRLRDCKIQHVLKNKRRLACEVPGCDFDFQKVYGELGYGFAHVHHLKPLGKVSGKRTTRLKDLAIVCANCHAMIHKGGACRLLGGLIKHGN